MNPEMHGTPSPGASLVYRMAWIFYLVLALGGVFWMGWREGRIELATFIGRDTWALDLGVGIVSGGLLIAGWRGVRKVFVSARELEARLAELLGPLQTGEVVGLALLSGFAEEVFFRGAMQGAWGWLPATIVFTLLHTGPGASYRIWTVFAAAAGVIFAGLMIWRGNLLAPVVTHTLVNGVNLGQIARRAHDRAGRRG